MTSPLALTLWELQGLMDELRGRAEVLGHVEGGFVVGLHAVVLDVHVAVVLHAGQHIVELPLCCIEDVSDAQIPEAGTLQSCFPVGTEPAMKLPSSLFTPRVSN